MGHLRGPIQAALAAPSAAIRALRPIKVHHAPIHPAVQPSGRPATGHVPAPNDPIRPAGGPLGRWAAGRPGRWVAAPGAADVALRHRSPAPPAPPAGRLRDRRRRPASRGAPGAGAPPDEDRAGRRSDGPASTVRRPTAPRPPMRTPLGRPPLVPDPPFRRSEDRCDPVSRRGALVRSPSLSVPPSSDPAGADPAVPPSSAIEPTLPGRRQPSAPCITDGTRPHPGQSGANRRPPVSRTIPQRCRPMPWSRSRPRTIGPWPNRNRRRFASRPRRHRRHHPRGPATGGTGPGQPFRSQPPDRPQVGFGGPRDPTAPVSAAPIPAGPPAAIPAAFVWRPPAPARRRRRDRPGADSPEPLVPSAPLLPRRRPPASSRPPHPPPPSPGSVPAADRARPAPEAAPQPPSAGDP